MSNESFPFTIRVYGLLIDQGSVLLSREGIKGALYTKFPGGGLEFGEGLKDCLAREFREEAAIEVVVGELFYLTEDFIPSAFHDRVQVISVYYSLTSAQCNRISVSDPSQMAPGEEAQTLFWQPLSTLDPKQLDLPIDRKVTEQLRQSMKTNH